MPNLENRISFLLAESVPYFTKHKLGQALNFINLCDVIYHEFFLSFLRHHAAMLDQGPEGSVVKVIYMALLCRIKISALDGNR